MSVVRSFLHGAYVGVTGDTRRAHAMREQLEHGMPNPAITAVKNMTTEELRAAIRERGQRHEEQWSRAEAAAQRLREL